VTDGQGHYGLTVFDVDGYSVSVAHAGVVTANWRIAPIG
jgi:hypothetical protein